MIRPLLALLATVTLPGASFAQVVFVSIPPQAFVVEQLAGESLGVEVLLPPGASPATYEPTPKQMVALDRSRLYLQIGAPFEGPVLEKARVLMPELQIVDCRNGVTLEHMADGHEHNTALFDPHIWLDPERMKRVASTSADALQKLLPQHAVQIGERLLTLHREIDDTDRRVSEILAPYEGRALLVFHPAYGYFTRRYGLVQMAVEADGKAPSARRLAMVIEELGDQPVRALFVQPQFSRSSAQRVADALECDLVEIDPLAGDYLNNLEVMARKIAGTMQ